jgi:uncharacterized RDD family membrane protein YckC
MNRLPGPAAPAPTYPVVAPWMPRDDAFDGVNRRRLLAWAIDHLLIGALIGMGFVALVILGVFTFGLAWGLLALFLVIPGPVLLVAYYAWLQGNGGATPGMRAADIELRTWDGRPVGVPQAALRTVLYILTWGLPVLFVVPLFTDRKRALHDILSGTTLIRTGRG